MNIIDIPPYISDIIGGHIHVKGDYANIISDLSKLGVLDDNGNKLKIPYDDSVSDLASNKDFINKFLFLLDIGVCLGRDYKLTYDPAYTAQYLKDNGVQIKSYQTISFGGQGGFEIEEH